jgi:hypothetical protein
MTAEYLNPENATKLLQSALDYADDLGNIPEREGIVAKINALEPFIGGEPVAHLSPEYFNAVQKIHANQTFEVLRPKDQRKYQMRSKIGEAAIRLVTAISNLQTFLNEEGDELADELIQEIGQLAIAYPATEEDKAKAAAKFVKRANRKGK